MHSNNIRMRGNIKYEMKNYKAAIKDFDKALDIPAKIADEKAWREGVYADAYYDHAWAKFDIEDLPGACEDQRRSHVEV